MKEVMTVNAASLFPEAPVSMDVLKKEKEKILGLYQASDAEKKILLMDAGDEELKNFFLDAGIAVKEADPKYGFVYGNTGAVKKAVLEDEKPIPGDVTEEVHAYSPENLLDAGTKTFFAEGHVKNKGEFTLPVKTTPAAILKECGAAGNFKAMYFGYPMGFFISPEQLENEIELTADLVKVFDEKDCMLDALLSVEKRFLQEACGRCVFGHEGTAQLNMILTDISLKKGKPTDIALMLELCGEMQNQSLCEIGRCAAGSAESALELFREEIENHITKKQCAAGVCSSFISWFIRPDLCTGCTDCEDACEDEAILGKKKFIHVIDQDECTQCGKCAEACEEGAIVRAAPGSIRCPRKPIPCRA